MDCTPSKREANRARKRAEIVAAAKRSFFEQGYAATSMSAISDEIGGSKATMWSHFASKEELFIAVVDTQIAQFASEIEEVLTSQTFSHATLRRFCLRFMEKLLRPESIQLFRLIVGEGERFPELVEIFNVRAPVRMVAHITDFFATRFSPAEAAALARVVTAALTGLRMHFLMNGLPVAQAAIEREIDLFLAHLRFPEAEPAAPAS